MPFQHMHHATTTHIHELMGLSPLDWTGFIAVLSFSFVASLHCAFMCTPLVCASLGNESHYKNISLWLYNFARIFSYTLMGLSLGAISQNIFLFNASGGALLSITVGSFLCLFSLSLLFKRAHLIGIRLLPQKVEKLLHSFSQFALSLKGWQRAGLLGLLTVFLPCASLTPALAMSLGSHSTFWGGAFMFAFGLGTLPIMVVSPALARFSLDKIPRKFLQVLSAFLLLGVGVITILRGVYSYPF